VFKLRRPSSGLCCQPTAVHQPPATSIQRATTSAR
jgi:hypothetical protein